MRGESTYLRYFPLIFYNFPTNTNSQKQNFLFICFLFYLFFQKLLSGPKPTWKAQEKGYESSGLGVIFGFYGETFGSGFGVSVKPMEGSMCGKPKMHGE